jgi:hypothetical protein
MSCSTFFCSHKNHKIENYINFEPVKKKFGPIYEELLNFLPKKSSLKVVTNEKGEAVGEVLTIIC